MKSEAKMDTHGGNFGRQFQSSTRACTSVSVSHATFYISWEVFVFLERFLFYNLRGFIIFKTWEVFIFLEAV